MNFERVEQYSVQVDYFEWYECYVKVEKSVEAVEYHSLISTVILSRFLGQPHTNCNTSKLY